MNDFPILDLVAALAFAVLAYRLWVSLGARRGIDDFNQELLRELDGGNLEQAQGLAEDEDVPVHAAVASRVLATAREYPESVNATELPSALADSWKRARRVQHRRIQSARGRDLAALALIVGAVAYARGSLDESTWFYVFAIGTGVALLLGFASRGGLLLASDAHRAELIAAIQRAALERTTAERVPCLLCGARARVAVDVGTRLHHALDSGQAYSIEALWVCSACGAVSGQASPTEGSTVPVATEPVERLSEE